MKKGIALIVLGVEFDAPFDKGVYQHENFIAG